MALDRLLDVGKIRDGPPHVVTEKVAQVVQRGHVLRVGHRDGEDVVLERDGHDLVDVRHRLRHDLQHVGRDVRLRQADDRHAPLLGQGFSHLRLGDESHADRHLPDDFPGTLLLLFEHVPELVLGEIPEVDQDLSQTSLCHAPRTPTTGIVVSRTSVRRGNTTRGSIFGSTTGGN